MLGVKNTVDDQLKVMVGNIEDITRIILELAYRYQRKVFSSTSEIYEKNTKHPYTERKNRLLRDPSIHRLVLCYHKITG
ncbi:MULTISPECIES: hypothetical protein [Bacillus]|uniref:hypothetical protein n=1 Tax=Bacillus TaxID=1386 RepID=UPI0006B06ADE|nr:hypothetical protein [Bacillus gobiensis]